MNKHTLGNILKIAATYTGTIIGAGFASGQEILRFFVAYGNDGLWGLIVAGCLFAWLGYIVMNLSFTLRAKGYYQLLYAVLGTKTGLLFDVLCALFLFGVLTVMLAGAGAVTEAYDLSYQTGLVGLGTAALLTALQGIKGIARVNTTIMPLLALATITVGTYSLCYHGMASLPPSIPPQAELAVAPHWLLGCLLYVSYNTVVGSTILVPLGAGIRSRRIRLWGSLAGSGMLILLAGFVVLALVLHYPGILSSQVPMLDISSMQHSSLYVFYALILLIAMYTTSIACLYGCAVKLQEVTRLSFFVCCLSLVSAGLIAGQVGFSQLIGLVFPVFGYLAFYFVLKLIWAGFRGN